MIINTYDQLMEARAVGLPDVMICSRYLSCGCHWWVSGWKLYSPGRDLDPTKTRNQCDPDWHCKVFEENKAGRAGALKLAKRYGKRYGVTKWKRNRMHDYVDERVNDRFPLRGK